MKKSFRRALRVLSLALAISCAATVGAFATPEEETNIDSLLTKIDSFAAEGMALVSSLGETSAESTAPAAAPQFPVSGTVDGGTINVRAAATTDSAVLTQVYTGKQVTVLGTEGAWYHVSFNGYDGYILGEYLLLDTAAAAAEVSAPADAPAPVETSAPAEPENALPATGTVDGGTINVRAAATTNSAVLTQVYTGKTVAILGLENGWYHISFDGYDGYILGEYLLMDGPAPAEVSAPAAYPMPGTVVGGTINVRAAAGTDAAQLTQVYTGKKVTILAREGDWYQVSFDGSTGYIFGEYVLEGEVDVASAGSSVGAQVAQEAQQYLGVRYVYGGASPSGFDCSGLTLYLYAKHGYSLSHSARAQYAAGTKVSKSDLQPGDLVFFSSPSTSSISHVGIYIGGGRVLHARQSLGYVTINSLSESYYSRYYYGACRIAG